MYVRDYTNPNKRIWKKVIVEEAMGKRIYLIRILEENIVWKRHIDQLIKAVDFNVESE